MGLPFRIALLAFFMVAIVYEPLRNSLIYTLGEQVGGVGGIGGMRATLLTSALLLTFFVSHSL
jgi:hypothetical protein